MKIIRTESRSFSNPGVFVKEVIVRSILNLRMPERYMEWVKSHSDTLLLSVNDCKWA